MKVTITAESSLTIVQNGRTVNIVKGDSFVLYGKVFAYKDIIVDVTKYLYVFSVKTEPSLPPIPVYEFIDNLTISQNGKTVKFLKGQQFRTVADVVWINGITLDLSVYAYAMKVLTNDKDEHDGLLTIKAIGSNVTYAPGLPTKVTPGEDLVITLTASTGYTIPSVKLNGSPVTDWTPGTAGTVQITNIQKDQVIEPTVEHIQFNVTNADHNPQNYHTSVDLPAKVNAGATFSTQISLVEGYKLTDVKVNGKPVTGWSATGGTISVQNVQEDLVIAITVEWITFNVTSAATDVIFSESLPMDIGYGEALEIEVTPKAGYNLQQCQYSINNGAPVTVPIQAGKATVNIASVKGNISIIANTSPIYYTVSIQGTNYDANPAVSSLNTVAHGSSKTVTITPSPDFLYKLKTVTLNGVEQPVTEDGYKCVVAMNNITANQVIVVTLESFAKKFPVTIDNENVDMVPAIPKDGVAVNSKLNGTLTPKAGYKLISAKIGTTLFTVSDNKAVISNFTMPSEAIVIEAVAEVLTYQITSNGENFIATPTLPATINHGSNFTTLITPTAGFKLTSVQAGSKVIEVGDGTSATVDLTNVTANTVITVVTGPEATPSSLEDEVLLP